MKGPDIETGTERSPILCFNHQMPAAARAGLWPKTDAGTQSGLGP